MANIILYENRIRFSMATANLNTKTLLSLTPIQGLLLQSLIERVKNKMKSMKYLKVYYRKKIQKIKIIKLVFLKQEKVVMKMQLIFIQNLQIKR